jgi:hypothetical protein
MKKQGGAQKFCRVITGGGREKFSENLSASPFNKELSNETTFSLIHPDGQNL